MAKALIFLFFKFNGDKTGHIRVDITLLNTLLSQSLIIYEGTNDCFIDICQLKVIVTEPRTETFAVNFCSFLFTKTWQHLSGLM